jgi:putative ABC transport system permease protein
VIRDIRFAIRMLRKQPSFALIAVLTLALGIGATAAVFSMIQGVLLTPPPYQNPQQLMLIQPARPDGPKLGAAVSWPALQWMDWQKQAKSFQSIAAYAWTFNFLIRDEGSESMEGMAVTAEYFRTTGLQPMMGRTFLDSETKPGGPPAIILGYELWKRSFHGDPQIVGKTIRMSRRETPPTVVGVMPPGVRFLPSPGVEQEPNYNMNSTVAFWVPASPNPARLKNRGWDVVGRLRDGVSPQQAQQELAVLVAQEAKDDRDFQGIAPTTKPLTVHMNAEGRRILLPLLGAAGLVLLIACGNVAALLLVRGLQRQQEYAVRSALGVGRLGLFCQVSTESLLLALLGGTLGAGLAFGMVKVFTLIGGHAIPRLDAVTTGWPVLVWGMGSAIVAALLAGLFPALRASRLDPMAIIKGGGPNSSAGRGERRLMRGVTMIQTALTLALLVGAGLLIRTMNNIAKVHSGFNTARVLTMSVTAVQGNLDDFHRRALDRVSAVGGVEAAAFAWGVPLTGNNWQSTVDVEGQPAASKPSDELKLPLRSVTPGYFNLLRLPVLEGRDFRLADDRKGPGVALVNQAFADRFFDHGNPVGRKIWLNGRDKPANEIIGMVGNSRTDDLTQAAEPEIYLCFWQNGAFSKHLVIRTKADPRNLLAAIQHELRSVDGTVAVENSKTLEQIRDDSLATRSFAMDLLIGFSIAGSVLTLVGIYGVLSLSVASRRRELAIRTAVGAEPGDIRKLIFGEGFRLVAAGVVAGVVAAVAMAGVLRSFLFGVEPTDPQTLITVGVLFAGVAMMACWVPTRRAMKVNPLDALRYE